MILCIKNDHYTDPKRIIIVIFVILRSFYDHIIAGHFNHQRYVFFSLASLITLVTPHVIPSVARDCKSQI